VQSLLCLVTPAKYCAMMTAPQRLVLFLLLHQRADSVLTNQIGQEQIVNDATEPSHHSKYAQHHDQVLQ